jgi:type VI secretion system protein ImpK
MDVSERPPPAEPPTPDAVPPVQGGDSGLAGRFAPCLTLILKLRSTREFGDPATLRRRIKGFLQRAERDALSTGAAPEAVRSAKFAVVAFLDETILASDWSEKEAWVNTPLQLELYDRYDAGEVFFDRLQTILDAPERRAEELEVYYLCLALGFKGKYQIHEQERRRELLERAARALRDHADRTTDGLSPQGRPQAPAAGEQRYWVPTWVIGVAALLAALLLYVGLSVYISGSAHEVAHAIQQMGAG